MFKKLSPKKLSDEIIEQFKELLCSGELQPGDILPAERQMAESFGVSRPPLREALIVLQAMGFIEIKSRNKIVVRSIAENQVKDPLMRFIDEDITKLFELLEIRKAMENWVAYMAAKRATKVDIERLEKILQLDHENLKNNRDDAKTDADFHFALSMATHNTIFSHLMASCYNILWDTQKMAREKIFKQKKNKEMIFNQHSEIFEAIKVGDSVRAGKQAKKHIDFVEQELRKVLQKDVSAALAQQDEKAP